MVDINQGKVTFQYVPTGFFQWLARVMEHGADKHEPFGFYKLREAGVEAYTDAAMRHILEHIEARQSGEVIALDPESEQPHLAHAAANCLIALELACHELKSFAGAPGDGPGDGPDEALDWPRCHRCGAFVSHNGTCENCAPGTCENCAPQ